ncbi:MAG: addiction module protein [Pyrinomonadaceae bacterium]
MSITGDNIQGIERVSELALGLSYEDRALLLGRLHGSLQSHEEKEIESAWLKESVRRAEEVRSGVVEPIDADIVFAESRAKLRK